MGFAPPAFAGCGCDHPAPAVGSVMPPFASPGKEIRIYTLNGVKLSLNKKYKVDFGGSGVVEVVAKHTDHVRVVVPASAGSDPGAKKLKVQGPGYDREYPPQLFTALPPVAAVPASGGSFAIWKYYGAISQDGTLLIPIDASAVRDPMQFAVHVTTTALAFGQDDVRIYNADNVDLTLFTLAVEQPTQRQWGKYYGWSVEDDTGLYGDFFDPLVLSKIDPFKTSDVFAYWRHEFHTYATAHGSGGTHVVDANGFHADGTLHIDHGRLVIAIQGGEREKGKTTVKELEPGKMEVDLVLVVKPAQGPLSAPYILDDIERAVQASVYQRERNFVEKTLVRVQ